MKPELMRAPPVVRNEAGLDVDTVVADNDPEAGLGRDVGAAALSEMAGMISERPLLPADAIVNIWRPSV